MSMKFALIHQEKARHSIGFMTRLLGVSRAGYYAWVKRQGTTSRRVMKPIEWRAFS